MLACAQDVSAATSGMIWPYLHFFETTPVGSAWSWDAQSSFRLRHNRRSAMISSSNVSSKRAHTSTRQQSSVGSSETTDLRRTTITLPDSVIKTLKIWGIPRDQSLTEVLQTAAHEFLVRNKLPGIPGIAIAETTPTPPALPAPRKPKRSVSRPKNPADASGSGGEPRPDGVPPQGGTLPPG